MLKNKKGMINVAEVLLVGAIFIIALVLIIIFSEEIMKVTGPFFAFLSKWWWLFPITFLIFIFREPLVLIFKKLLGAG